jgi:hypothetical protein
LKEARGSSTSASALYELAARIEEVEAELAAKAQPALDQLTEISQRFVDKTDPDKIDRAIYRYAEEGIDVGISWLESIQNYRIECLKLASEKGNARSIISTADELEREFSRILENET